jgi:hypothetical protein
MKNNQYSQQLDQQQTEQRQFEQDLSDAQDGAEYFAVTYLDTDCGRIRTESFDDAAAADRFANRCVAGEDGWAVVDAIRVKERRAAA